MISKALAYGDGYAAAMKDVDPDLKALAEALAVVSPLRPENHSRSCTYRTWAGGKCTCWLAKSGRWPLGHPNHREEVNK